MVRVMSQLYCVLIFSIVSNAASIAQKWRQCGVAGNTEDVNNVIDALSGAGKRDYLCPLALV